MVHLFQERRDDLINPYWIEDPELKKGEVDFLSPSELQFWKDLIDKYLYPIDANKEEEVFDKLFTLLCKTKNRRNKNIIIIYITFK